MSNAAPEGWVQKRLGAIAEIILGQSPPSSVVNADGDGLPFIQGNAEFGPRSPTPALFARDAPKKAETGDVLLSVRAPVGEVNVSEGPLCIGRGVAAIRAHACDRDYLFYAVGGLQSAFARLSQGSTFDAINGKELRQLSITVPPLDEQRRIAEVLQSVDDTIAETTAVISSSFQMVRSLREKMFAATGHSVPVSALALLISGQHIPTERYNTSGHGVPYLTGPSDFPHGRIISSKFTPNPSVICQPNDILITVKGSGVGKAVVADASYCISRQLMALRSSGAAVTYLFEAVQTIVEGLNEEASGPIPGITRDHILLMRIPAHTNEQQEAIGEAFSKLRSAASVAEDQIQQLSGLKTALASDLLSGRVRVPA